MKKSDVLKLKIKNLFTKKNLGIFIYKNSNNKISISYYPKLPIKQSIKKQKLQKNCRAYISISHEFVDFEIVTLPANLPLEKQISAAKLEVIRILRLLKKDDLNQFLFSFYSISKEKVLVTLIQKSKLENLLDILPENIIIGGIFPSWCGLFSYLKNKNLMRPDTLYYVRSEKGFEGFWLFGNELAGILPFSPLSARKFFEHFDGNIEELPSLNVISEGSYYFPFIFSSENVPVFNFSPYLVQHDFSARNLFFWILPILIYFASFFISFENKNLLQDIGEIEANLKSIKNKYEQLENIRKNFKEQKELYSYIEKYLPGRRPSILKYLLELTLSFPKDAWISRLEYWYPDKLRLWGEAKNALQVLEILSKNILFKDVKFTSTVIKNPRTDLETFSVQLSIRFPEEKNRSDRDIGK